MYSDLAQVKQMSAAAKGVVPASVYDASEPMVLRGFVRHWPMVAQASTSDEASVQYLSQFCADKPVIFYEAEHHAQGRIFYNESCDGFEFKPGRMDFKAFLRELLAEQQNEAPRTLYLGSTTVDTYLPGLRKENDIALDFDNPLVSIWIGNQSRVAAHFDAPDNIACCVAGKRRFILFPMAQVENLYVGPLDFTPSGQSISMVDFANPDFERFPKFKHALEHALVAELEPGDALYLPSMWWHHVESFSPFNILVNYWYRNVPRFMEPPINVLHHAMMSLRDLPEREKRAWKTLFDYYIFDAKPDQFTHIPEKARGFLNPMDENLARRLRSWLLNKLNR